jgi:hypothetical protein
MKGTKGITYNKGITYICWWGLSINEGEVPNIHLNWSRWIGSPSGTDSFWGFYICLTRKRRYFWFSKISEED